MSIYQPVFQPQTKSKHYNNLFRHLIQMTTLFHNFSPKITEKDNSCLCHSHKTFTGKLVSSSFFHMIRSDCSKSVPRHTSFLRSRLLLTSWNVSANKAYVNLVKKPSYVTNTKGTQKERKKKRENKRPHYQKL